MIIEMMNDMTLTDNDKDWVKAFEIRVDDILKNDYFNNNNYRFDFNEICKSIGLDSTLLNKEGTLMYALWVTLLNGIRKFKLLASFKYPTIELFLNHFDYYDKFKHENELEIKKLWYIANWMSYLFTMVSAKKNKGLAMIVIPKLIEGWNIKYITGSGQTRATTNRVHIFECEGNVKANHRGKVKKLKMLEDDKTNEAASLLLSQIKNQEKNMKPKKRKIMNNKNKNTINNNIIHNSTSNYHDIIIDDNNDDYNNHHQMMIHDYDHNNNYNQQIDVNISNNIDHNYSNMQYFQTNEFDLLEYNPIEMNDNIIIHNINDNNTINTNNNIINNNNSINNDNIDDTHNYNDIHNINSSGIKRTFDISLNNEIYNFNDWKEKN